MLVIAYAALLLLGLFGAHRFYLGRWISGLVLCALTIFCVGATLASLGTLIIFFVVPLAWLLVDIVLLPRLVRRRLASKDHRALRS